MKINVNFLFPQAGILFIQGILMQTFELFKECDKAKLLLYLQMVAIQ